MLKLLEVNRVSIEDFCRRFRVRRLDLFGSAVRGEFDPVTSDLDFLVEFEPMPPGEYAAAFFGLQEELENLLERPIDLITSSSLKNPFFRASVQKERLQLYAA